MIARIRRFHPLISFFLLLIAVTPTFARKDPVKWSATITPAIARPGERVTVTVKAEIDPTYHIYSSEKLKGEGPQPTELTISGASLSPDEVTGESTPEMKNDPNFQNIRIGLHSTQATFSRQLLVSLEAQKKTVPLTVSVKFMACTDQFCLRPKTVQIPVPAVTIEAGAPRPEFTTPLAVSVPASSQPSNPGVLIDASTGNADGSMFTFLLAAFGAGLLALITPCVFPLIPVTFAFFTKEASRHGGSTLRLAVTYGAAIILMFTALGGIMAATVGAAGANQLAANPWVNLVFGVLFVLFGIALLEVIELRLPASLQNLGGGRNAVGGVLGVFFMGLTFAIATFTCTAPFIGTVLVAASSATSAGGWVRPILGMMTFSSAIALPFFLLAIFPGLLAKLPKSGAWLSTVKGTMGFLELAAALKFFSNSDLVWQTKWLTAPVILAFWMAISLAAAIYLLGYLKIGYGAPDAPATPVRKLWAALFVIAGLYCAYGLTGRPLNEWMVAFLPPAEYSYASSDKSITVADSDGLEWLEDLDKAQARAKAENKRLFVDFTGYTCTNCRWMEKNIFPATEVKSEMEKFVRVRLYVDGGPNMLKYQEFQEKVFGDVALPLYGVLTPDGKPVAKSAGITRPASKFVEFLQMSQRTQTARSN